jgi:hypothetical protein
MTERCGVEHRYCLRMILPENRCTLFRIKRYCLRMILPENRCTLFRIKR